MLLVGTDRFFSMINAAKKDKKGEGGQIKIYMIVYIFIWVLLLLFIIWRAKMGAASYDESLYLTIPYRLYRGDAMIHDEWNLSQLSSFATIPFIYFYTHIFHGTDGITLAYRYYSVAVWAIVSLAIFFKLRRYLESRKLSQGWAAVSSAVMMVYAPFGMLVLSYNTYAIITLILAGIILLPGDDGYPEGTLRWVIAGFVYAYSVLCSPHILLLWILGFIYALYKKKIRRFVYFTMGAGCLAAILGLYIISRASVGQIMSVIPVMLSDPYHQQMSVFGYVKDYIIQVLFGIPNVLWIYICFVLLFIAAAVDKERSRRRSIYFILGCILTLALLIFAFVFRRYINCFIYPLNILALLCMILGTDEKALPLFECFWLPGMIYSFCINMSSNQYYLAISSSSLAALAGSIVIIGIFVGDLSGDITWIKKTCISLYVSMLAVLFAFLVILRYSFVFMNSEVSLQTESIDKGPQKGIMSTLQDRDIYEGIYADAIEMEEHNPDRILFFARDNWPYLMNTWKCGAYSPWLQNEIDDYTVRMLQAYYAMDGSRKPDIIYIDSRYSKYAKELLKVLDFKIVKTFPSGNMMAVPTGQY